MHNFSLSGKKVLVTGASGFIGSHLTRALLARGSSVIAGVRPQGNDGRLKDISGDLQFCPLDLSDFRAQDLIHHNIKPQIIFHLGAYGVEQHQSDTDLMLRTNFYGTRELLKFARLSAVERFVYCGSCFEYPSGTMIKESTMPEPLSEYGASKSAAWMFVGQSFRQHHLPVVSLRPFTVYGPGESPNRLVSFVIQSLLNNKPLELTGGEQTRDFVFVNDVVEAFLLAGVTEGIDGETFNVASGIETSVKDLVLKIMELMQVKSKPLFGARPYRELELWKLSGDPSKAAEKLNWKVRTSLEDGLRIMIQKYAATKRG